MPAEKLRFLHYVNDGTVGWWSHHREHGAVLLGKAAEERNLTRVIG